jgi:hypothetical protein
VVHPRPSHPAPRVPNPRTARAATHARVSNNARSRYRSLARIFTALGSLLALLLLYVMLTSNVTGLTYAVARGQHQREAMQEENVRLDDRIAALRSDDRLSAVAARLGMHEPQRFALVKLAAPAVADTHSQFAVLPSLAGFFMPAVARQTR